MSPYSKLWMSRVPTDSNIANDPSRGHVDLLASVGCCRQNLHVQLVWNALLDFARGEVRCDGSFNVSGFPIRLNYAVQRIAA